MLPSKLMNRSEAFQFKAFDNSQPNKGSTNIQFTCTMQWRPAIRVLGVYVTTELNQKPVKLIENCVMQKLFQSKNFFNHASDKLETNSLDNLQMSSADGIMQCCDSLVIGRTRVGHLHGGFLHQLEFSLETRVEQQSQWIKAHPPR